MLVMDPGAAVNDGDMGPLHDLQRLVLWTYGFVFIFPTYALSNTILAVIQK